MSLQQAVCYVQIPCRLSGEPICHYQGPGWDPVDLGPPTQPPPLGSSPTDLLLLTLAMRPHFPAAKGKSY